MISYWRCGYLDCREVNWQTVSAFDKHIDGTVSLENPDRESINNLRVFWPDDACFISWLIWKMLLLLVFVSLRNEKKSWREGSVVTSNFLPEGLSLLPRNHMMWLTTVCNSSSMELPCLWPPCVPALRGTSTLMHTLHRYTHTQRQRLWIEREQGVEERKKEDNVIIF